MARFVPDQSTRRWVVISPIRAFRPEDTSAIFNFQPPTPNSCPFCPGNEDLTPPEVWRVGGEGSWNKQGWKVRVVPNKYKITDIHEVIIHSPDSKADIEDLPLEQVKLILTVYRQRLQTHEKDGHVLIFCNHGIHAGASLSHPHSQLVVIPRQITLDSLSLEPLNNLVSENTYFNVYCPDFSQWPYEIWIAPKEKRQQAQEAEIFFSQISDEEISDLAQILKTTLQKLVKIAKGPQAQKINVDPDFSYNYYLHQGKQWYLRIIPRFIHRAGFELGTGLSVNVVDPAKAAEELKQVSP